MEEGRCQAIAVDEETYDKWQGESQYCTLVRVGNSLFSLSNVIPMADWVGDTISLLLSTEKTNGNWDRVLQKYLTYYKIN